MPTLYIDLMSQPSRACYILCKKFDLPVHIQMIRLDKGQHKQQPYLSINPLGKVPFLSDGPLKLPESAAIMAYLAELYQLPEQWHPHTPSNSSSHSSSSNPPPSSSTITSNNLSTSIPSTTSSSKPSPSNDNALPARTAALQRRAVFDAAVHWWHLNIRRGCMTYAFATVIGPRVFNVPASPPVAAHGLQILRQALKDLDTYWLAGGSKPFMTGADVSVADVLCVCELEQLHMMVAEPSSPQLDQLLHPHPAVHNWMQRVRQAVGPAVYDDAHGKLRAAVQRLAAAGRDRGGSKL